MAIRRISPPTASTPGYVPDIETDYNAQNDMIQALTLNTTPQIPISLSGVIPRGTILNDGGVLYRADADTSIAPGTNPGIYVELVPSTDGSELIPYWVSGIGPWNSEYQGFYSPDGNLMLDTTYEGTPDIDTTKRTLALTFDTYPSRIAYDAVTDSYLSASGSSAPYKLWVLEGWSNTVRFTVDFPAIIGPLEVKDGNLYVLNGSSYADIKKYVGLSNVVSETLTITGAPAGVATDIGFCGDDLIISVGAATTTGYIYHYNGFSMNLKATYTFSIGSDESVRGVSSNGREFFITTLNTLAAPDINKRMITAGLSGTILDSVTVTDNNVNYGANCFNGQNFVLINVKSDFRQFIEFSSILEMNQYNSLGKATKVNP